MNADRSNHLRFKYLRFTQISCKDKGIRKFEFVAKSLFLSYTKMYSKMKKKLKEIFS